MSAGAFSSDAAVEAADELVAVKIDCTEPDQNTEVQKHYNINGYPTVLFATNEEKTVEDLYPQDGDEFAEEIRAFAAKHSAWVRGWEGALSLGARWKRPVVILRPDAKPEDWEAERARFKDHLDKFVFGRSEPGTKEREKLDKLIGGNAAVIVVDPRLKEPFKSPLSVSDSADALNKVIKDWKKEQP